MLNSGVLANGVETTVVVGEHQSVGRHDNTRAEAAKVDNGILHRIVALVELLHWQLEPILLHLLVDGSRQVVQSPHAFIGMGQIH